MDTIIMRGKPVVDFYREKIAAKIAAAKEKGLIVTLAIVVVGDDAASHVYKGRLVKLLESLGGAVKLVELPATATQEEVIKAVRKLNRNRYIQGLLPMMPLPKHLDAYEICAAILGNKDMDCLNPLNVGALFLGQSPWAPCTPRACMAILKYYGIELEGKHAVVIGRSNVVGKPVADLLLEQNATVTVCHSHTHNLAALLQTADIVVAAVGKAGFVKADMLKDGVVIVDVGINAVDGKLVGDVDPAAYAKASAYTPVPGGVGVVSNMMVMECLTKNL